MPVNFSPAPLNQRSNEGLMPLHKAITESVQYGSNSALPPDQPDAEGLGFRES